MTAGTVLAVRAAARAVTVAVRVAPICTWFPFGAPPVKVKSVPPTVTLLLFAGWAENVNVPEADPASTETGAPKASFSQ